METISKTLTNNLDNILSVLRKHACKKILIVDASCSPDELVKQLVKDDSIIIIEPQTYCFETAISAINRVKSRLISDMKEFLKRSGLRDKSRKQLEELFKEYTVRVINQYRFLRDKASKNKVIVSNIPYNEAYRFTSKLEELVGSVISNRSYNKLIKTRDHYYIILWLKCLSKGLYTEFKTLDKDLEETIENLL